MREIIFRGKTPEGAWVYSDCIMQFKDLMPKLWKTDSGWVDVIPETVGQFTGLRDKNGKWIFEGDVIACSYNGKYRAVVKAEIENCGCCHPVFGFAPVDKDGDPTDDATFDNCVVIGNIHDNPELLTE